jgi:hypothetical protein
MKKFCHSFERARPSLERRRRRRHGFIAHLASAPSLSRKLPTTNTTNL